MTRDEYEKMLVGEVQRWVTLKVPFKHRGTTIRGCDCMGLIVGAARNIGLFTQFSMPQYQEGWQHRVESYSPLLFHLSFYADRIQTSELKPSDILVFRFNKVVCHCGVYMGKGYFAHSHQKSVVHTDMIVGSPWTSRLDSIWRFDMEKIT